MTHYEVREADTAAEVGSGDVPCLATPRLIAWMEAETCAVVHDQIAESATTVGTFVSVEHLAASAVGSRVSVSAQVVNATEHQVEFDVTAVDAASDRVLARGTVRRAIVDRRRFIDRLGRPGDR